jgi:hypothetical protein
MTLKFGFKQNFTSYCAFLTLIIFYLSILTKSKSITDKHYQVFRTIQDDFYLAHFLEKKIYKIPDNETAFELGYTGNNSVFSLNRLLFDDKFELIEAPVLPSLKHANFWPDERMRVIIDKLLILQPPSFVKEMHIIKNVFNPAMVQFQSKVLMCWRSSEENSFLKFGWLSNDKNEIFELEGLF